VSTIKQKQALEKIIENRGNVSKAMLAVGYDETTAKNPSNLINSKGFKELCEQHGLTDDFLIKALVADIKKKKGNRKPELELAFKVKGRLKEKEEGGDTFNTIIFNAGDERTIRIARRVLNGDSPGAKLPN
jgi:hypothetical protein